VLVLVLESGRAERWSIGALDYCAKSELHPATAGLEMLKAFQNQLVWTLPILKPIKMGGHSN
jgi:hypothetical protein